MILGGRYMVVDCGGGTVDITVHEISNEVHISFCFLLMRYILLLTALAFNLFLEDRLILLFADLTF